MRKPKELDDSSGPSEFVWSGIFSTVSELHNDEVTNHSIFAEERWIDRMQKFVDVAQDGSVFPPRPTTLPFLLTLYMDLSSVLDFGGGSGWVLDRIKTSIKLYDLKVYHVFELSSLIAKFNKCLIARDPILEFKSDVHSLGQYDVFYANSSLQYVLDEHLLLEIIDKANPKFILIDNFLGGDIPSYFSLQNYYDNAIPVKFRNLAMFTESLRFLGFRLCLDYPYQEPIRGVVDVFDMSNFPENLRIRFGRTLLYRR